MTKAHLATILEIISFFFVTTDLYGPERLAEVRERIITIKRGKNGARAGGAADHFLVIIIFLGTLYFLYYFLGDWGRSFFSSPHEPMNLFSRILLFVIAGFAVVLAIVMVGFVSFLFSVLIFGVTSAIIIYFTLWGIRTLLRILSLKGLLLIIGTILFLISKFISWQ
jgi:hypothetical protein